MPKQELPPKSQNINHASLLENSRGLPWTQRIIFKMYSGHQIQVHMARVISQQDKNLCNYDSSLLWEWNTCKT